MSGHPALFFPSPFANHIRHQRAQRVRTHNAAAAAAAAVAASSRRPTYRDAGIQTPNWKNMAQTESEQAAEFLLRRDNRDKEVRRLEVLRKELEAEKKRLAGLARAGGG
ncbi:MAG: hypothetical protein LQ340_001239, partial [Diploschistes diacapsis]